ncbi:Ribonuclease Z [Pseudoalteromonas luteoviolacea B = ATCC 29581]|nr:Ribonuclease Z [Pseudoalteromonas luteoviolacea B = ATCC 29581]
MDLHFFGTSSGCPSKTRNVSATGVSFERCKSWLLVDCGEGTQHQLLHSTLSPYRLGVVAVSHVHGDHCYGLPGVLAAIQMSGRKEPVALVAPQKVIEFVRCTFELTDLQLAFNLVCHPLEEVQQAINFEGFMLEVITLKHRVPSYGFKITETVIPNKLHLDKLNRQGIKSGSHYNCLQKGQDVEYENHVLTAKEYTYPSWQPRTVIVCGDNEKPSLIAPWIKEADTLVHEATFTSKDLSKIGYHTGHSDAARVAQFAEMHALNHLILTHFSVRYHGENGLASIEHEAKRYYSGHLTLAYDGLVVNIPKQLNKQ